MRAGFSALDIVVGLSCKELYWSIGGLMLVMMVDDAIRKGSA